MATELTRLTIDYQAMVEQARGPSSGAVVLFLGTVRDVSEGRSVSGLEYDAYPAMARAKLDELAREAAVRWPLNAVHVTHRYGRLELADVAVAVVTASAHRAAAFESAQWIMDTIKSVAPIWKKELWAEGTSDWVHPGADVAEPSSESAHRG